MKTSDVTDSSINKSYSKKQKKNVMISAWHYIGMIDE